ncbi:hypothetical protein [Gelatiniphilus marinus]|uniref:Uncharacterized protein n=1 Tax=Gelatiniphilus marinus TaxID=1759464 RepID=A0ABW5JRZ2_9FLAO
MDNSEFRKKYWSELKPLVGNMISEAPLHFDKHQYVRDCWEKLENELKKYNLNETDFRDVNAKLRKQIENDILRK